MVRGVGCTFKEHRNIDMKRVLIANRGESGRLAGASANRSACAAGDGDLATLC